MANRAEFVQTKAAKLKNGNGFECIEFVSHKSKRKPSNTQRVTSKETSTDEQPANDLKKLRYEVIKFGATGMTTDDKTASSVALAVALGAKPPKKKFRNYKEILAEKRQHRENLPCTDLKNKKEKFPVFQSSQSKPHFHVVGNKVVAAKSKAREGAYKNFLHKYGTANGPTSSSSPEKAKTMKRRGKL